MRAVRRGIGAGLLGVIAACGQPAAFRCENDMQCGTAIDGDQCELDGYCSVFDENCASGRRYTEFAGGGLADVCVPGTGPSSDTGADDGDDATNSTGDGSTSTTGSDGPDDGTTEDDDDGIAPTAGSPDDPYGRCEEGCGFDGAACLMSEDENGPFLMCSPPCDVANNPSSMCPDPLGGGYSVGCLGTGSPDEVSCFINCDADMQCPNGMICALSTVCSWQ